MGGKTRDRAGSTDSAGADASDSAAGVGAVGAAGSLPLQLLDGSVQVRGRAHGDRVYLERGARRSVSRRVVVPIGISLCIASRCRSESNDSLTHSRVFSTPPALARGRRLRGSRAVSRLSARAYPSLFVSRGRPHAHRLDTQMVPVKHGKCARDVVRTVSFLLDVAPANEGCLALYHAPDGSRIERAFSPDTPVERLLRAAGVAVPGGGGGGVTRGGRVVLMVRLFTEELERAHDAGTVRLLYLQAVANVAAGLWPCPRDDGAALVALRLWAALERTSADPSAAMPSRIAKLLRGQLARWVPPSLLGQGVVTAEIEAGWEKAVTMVLPQLVEDLDQTLQSGGPEEAYIAITEEWEWYGAVFFTCSAPRVAQQTATPVVPSLPETCTAAITRDGISIYEPGRQPRLRLFHKRQLRRWSAPAGSTGGGGGRSFRFEYELDEQLSDHAPPVVCEFQTEHGAEIVELLDDYAMREQIEIPAQFEWVRKSTKLPWDAEDGKAPPSYYTIVLELYELLVHAIIRPPRFNYEDRLLGPSSFAFCGLRFHRTDITLINGRGERLMCSHWTPAGAAAGGAAAGKRPCVVFMHANSASRIQALA